VGLSWQSRTNISLLLLLMCDGGPGHVVLVDMAGNVAGRYNLFRVGLEWLAVSYKSIYVAY
jgi:phage/plasmid-associated DNA primase